jgi:lytic murein transglycosylase
MRAARIIVAALGAACIASAQGGGFEDCLAGVRADAARRGIDAASFARITGGLAPDMEVLAFLDRQPEFVTPIWDYMAGLVDEERIADGRAMLAQWGEVLARVERQYGVDPATVVAVWGVESNYGKNFGKRPLLGSLSALACFGRRQDYFRGEFLNTLEILDRGDVAQESLTGSWAGAFGQTQFMPSTFLRLAVDFDGDGRRDLIGSVPDALASTANFLSDAGWRSGEGWGFEVTLPQGAAIASDGRRDRKPMSRWAALGLRLADGSPLPAGDTPAGLLLPAGAEGPAFLVLRNFEAIYRYNAAESYALAIAHLSDRLRGGGSFATPWPTDDPPLSRAERRELQEHLLRRGHDIGEADGIIGSRSREAVKAVQVEAGMEPSGRAGGKLLQWLRAAAVKGGS